ncbi:MAG: YceG family protein [Oscillospiraceae bacterium]
MAGNFVRIVGYDNSDSFRSKIITKFAAAQKNGLFFDNKLPLASTAEISQAASYAADNLDDERAIKAGIDSYFAQKRLNADTAQLAHLMLEAMNSCGANKKNTYFVILCWLMKYAPAKPAEILYINKATKRELYLLYMLNLLGAAVTYVSLGEDAEFDAFPYKNAVQLINGPQTAQVQIDFANLDLSRERQLADMRQAAESIAGRVQRADTTAAGIFEDMMVTHKQRVIKRGGVFTDNCEIPVYMAALIGYDEEAVYTNMLVKFKEGFASSKKQLIFIGKTLDNPTAEEVKLLGTVPRRSSEEMIDGLALLIKLPGDPVRTALAQKALKEVLTGIAATNQTVALNYGNKLITWLYRCTQARKYSVQYEDIPLILYYGDISQSELFFLHFMSRSGFDVIYITPNKTMLQLTAEKNTDGRMQIFELPKSKDSGEYPDKPIKMKMATVAYSAERELDEMMYNGDAGIFRDFQFPNSQSITLKTTYEEIDILWKHEAKFRSGFSVSGNLVCVPNIFAKISGVKDGNINAYWDDVRAKLTPETVLYVKTSAAQTPGGLDLSAYRSFYRNGKIDTERLKSSMLNKYSYLPDRIQDLILFKLQETIDSGYLKLQGDDLMCAVMHFGLNLDKEMLKIIQRFDFTKQIPKLIYIDPVEETFTLQECVLAVLCSIIGFDVLIYTPTGYKNIETFVKPEAFEEHTMNEFLYNLEVPRFKIPTEEKSGGGLFGKLFRK